MTVAATKIECVSFTGDICGEGPVWHAEHRALYWTDINRFLLHRFAPETGATHSWQFEEPVTAVNLTTDPDILLLVLGSCIGKWSPSTHPRVEVLYRLQGWPDIRFNDASVGPRGSLWAGTMRNNVGSSGENLDVSFDVGVLYRIGPDGAASEWKSDIGCSNTVAWSPDFKTFYFGDTIANAIYQYDYDSDTDSIANEQPFLVGHPIGVPDGSAMDCKGFLWNTRPGARSVIRVAPGGEVVQTVELPVERPACCAFGGNDLKTLYITTARSADQLCGNLFALQAEVPGVPDRRFLLP